MLRFLWCFTLFGVLVCGGCASMVVGTGGQAGSGSEQRSQAERDVEITNQINARFVNDPLIPALDIRVTTADGVVTLRGRVPSRGVAARARETAESVRGVVRVVDHLTAVQ